MRFLRFSLGVTLVIVGWTATPVRAAGGCAGGGCGGSGDDILSLPALSIGNAAVTVDFEHRPTTGSYGATTRSHEVEVNLGGFWFRVNDRPGWEVVDVVGSENGIVYEGSPGEYTSVSFTVHDIAGGNYYFYEKEAAGSWSTYSEIRAATREKIPLLKISGSPTGTPIHVAFSYDVFGRVIQQTNADGSALIYGYADPCDAGSLLNRIWLGSNPNDYAARPNTPADGRWVDLDYNPSTQRLSHIQQGCGSCGGGQRYFEYVEASTSNDYLVSKVKSADPNQTLMSYTFDAEDHWISRWLGDPDTGLKIAQKVYYEYNYFDPNETNRRTLIRRDYVDNTYYRARVYVTNLAGAILDEYHYHDLQSGDILTGDYSRYSYAYSHDSHGRLTQVITTLPKGNKVYEYYNASTAGLSVRKRCGYDSDPITEDQYEYDLETVGDGQKLMMTQHTNIDGGETTYEYDHNSLRMERQTEPAVLAWNRPACCECSQWGLMGCEDPDYCYETDPACTEPPLQQVTEYTYGGYQGRLQTECRKDANGDTVCTRYAYDGAGNISAQFEPYDLVHCDPNEPNSCDPDFVNITTYTYNEFNQQTAVTDPQGRIQKTFYSSSGAAIAEAIATADVPDTLYSATKYTYNENGWLTAKGVAKENSTFSQSDLLYDLENPLTPHLTWVNEEYYYDDYGRRISVIADAAGQALTTTYQYNNLSEITQITYPDGRYKKTEWDGRGLVVREIVGKGQQDFATTYFYYDLNGNLIKKVDPEGVAEVYQYDVFDRMVRSRRGQ